MKTIQTLVKGSPLTNHEMEETHGGNLANLNNGMFCDCKNSPDNVAGCHHNTNNAFNCTCEGNQTNTNASFWCDCDAGSGGAIWGTTINISATC